MLKSAHPVNPRLPIRNEFGTVIGNAPPASQSQNRDPMRTLFLIPVLTCVALPGAEETSAPTVRQKLRAKIMESVPAAPPPKPPTGQKEEAAPPIVMPPVVVS